MAKDYWKPQKGKERSIKIATWCLKHGNHALQEHRTLDAEVFKAAMKEIERLAGLERNV